MEDQISALLREHQSLSWIQPFLFDHKEAKLFLVGGAVRDACLKRQTKDFDFVLSGLNKDAIEKWFGAHGEVDFTGKTFGVYKFIPAVVSSRFPIEPIDIALPRTESSLPDSQGGYREFAIEARMDLPIEMDLGRRDFTVNAMAYDIGAGKLIDPFHGLRDIKAKVIRAVGVPTERFQEDLTRLLRAIRFSCSLGFHIEENTWNAIHDSAARINYLKTDDSWIVPREAVGREFLKSFLHDPACTLIKYDVSGLFALLFHEFDLTRATALTSDAAGLTPRLLVALFLSAADPIEAQRRADEYRFYQFPKDGRWHIDLEEVMWLLRSAHALDVIEDPLAIPGSLFERIFLGAKGEELLALMHLTGSAPQTKITAVRQRINEIRQRLGDDIPELLNGDNLIAAGIKPGPAIRELKNKIRDAQFAGTISTKQEANDYLKTLL